MGLHEVEVQTRLMWSLSVRLSVGLSVTFFVSQTGSVSSLLLLDNVALGPGGVQARVLLAIRERERRPRRHFPLIRKFKLFA